MHTEYGHGRGVFLGCVSHQDKTVFRKGDPKPATVLVLVFCFHSTLHWDLRLSAEGINNRSFGDFKPKLFGIHVVYTKGKIEGFCGLASKNAQRVLPGGGSLLTSRLKGVQSSVRTVDRKGKQGFCKKVTIILYTCISERVKDIKSSKATKPIWFQSRLERHKHSTTITERGKFSGGASQKRFENRPYSKYSILYWWY